MNNKGFTLIEIVMVIVLFGIIMPGIMFYFMQGVKDSAIPQRRTTAIFLSEALMEEIKSKRWDENAPNINSTCSNATLPLITEEATRNLYDDVDDFNSIAGVSPPQNSQGVSLGSSYQGFSQTVTVSYVNSGDLETPVAGPTCYKRIEVRIIDATNNENTRLVSLMTSY